MDSKESPDLLAGRCHIYPFLQSPLCQGSPLSVTFLKEANKG